MAAMPSFFSIKIKIMLDKNLSILTKLVLEPEIIEYHANSFGNVSSSFISLSTTCETLYLESNRPKCHGLHLKCVLDASSINFMAFSGWGPLNETNVNLFYVFYVRLNWTDRWHL